jgi:hypothetical protein
MTDTEPHAALRAAGDEFKALRDQLESARDRLQPLMVDALRNGTPQTKVVQLSGYTRESVRALARKNGIEPK